MIDTMLNNILKIDFTYRKLLFTTSWGSNKKGGGVI